ncbi:Ppx/GppA phosphatase family protein [Desulfurispira natronophila]|uniref:Exopolyphosphatase/guanosine-5'-triphosphate, 3'-diphosphate pyrophosphatase n=1 Tax=Desulfurispira natronophila TaxID=682562 RepID=A0A7W8DFS3_9BACT|nr:Ppx/GppA phosphatase family protein [Desulfurispira natronophila]MBB5020746.1 exopolyphosphatase/guanosine-5'-triphosphate,3'-diphosphate pyrophosphatase [Desulfurispira natronophila]
MSAPLLLGAIDIGSNTIRLLIGEYSLSKGLITRHSERQVTRLGKRMSNGLLLADAIDYSVKVLQEYREILDDYGIEDQQIMAVATSAVRNARNRDEFIASVKQHTGINVQVVNGEQEARLSALGVCAAIKVAGSKLVVDIGGGSVEFILLGKDGEVQFSDSVEMGVVRLTEKFITRAPMQIDEYLSMQEFVLKKVQAIQKQVSQFELSNLKIVGTAGTYTTAAHVLSGGGEYHPQRINGFSCSVRETKQLLDKISSLTLAQRLEVFPVEKGREDVIIAGLCLAININQVFHLDHYVVSDYGLREGILIDMAQKPA